MEPQNHRRHPAALARCDSTAPVFLHQFKSSWYLKNASDEDLLNLRQQLTDAGIGPALCIPAVGISTFFPSIRTKDRLCDGSAIDLASRWMKFWSRAIRVMMPACFFFRVFRESWWRMQILNSSKQPSRYQPLMPPKSWPTGSSRALSGLGLFLFVRIHV